MQAESIIEQAIFLNIISVRIIYITLKFIYNKKVFITVICRKEMAKRFAVMR